MTTYRKMTTPSQLCRFAMRGSLFGSMLLSSSPSRANARPPQRVPTGVPMKEPHSRSHKRTSLPLQERRLVNASGVVRMILSTRSGVPEFTLLGQDGQVLLSASLDANGLGSVQISNPAKDGPRAALALDDKGRM